MRRGRRPRGIKRVWDQARVAASLARPGIDTRQWVGYGTVASVRGEGGAFDYSDESAVIVSPNGVEVDVALEPENHPLTCRYGIQAGDAFICAPIRPGDQVIVLIPGGDLQGIGEIVKVIPGASAKIPVEDDGKPVFRNDRVSVLARGVPIEIRVMDGGRMLLNPDGTIQLGGPPAAQQLVRGTAFRSRQATLNSAIQAAAAAIAASAATPDLSFTAAFATTAAKFVVLATQMTAIVNAITSFEGASAEYLSEKNKTT